MKYLMIVALLYSPSFLSAQSASFPQSWTGDWKGELQWFKTGSPEPQKVNMELRIRPADSARTYTWNLIYGSSSADNRPYLLIPKDTSGTHWVVDENNGIKLDMYQVGEKFCGAFTVRNATIFNKYWIEGEELIVEFLTIGAKPLITTGNGNDEIPFVDSYKVNGYQLARLRRQ